MRVYNTKTSRFAAIVKECGTPEVVSLWGPPSPGFLKAVEQDRVITVKQETVGAKADLGVVGFMQEKNVSYLLFPQSLKRFRNTRVIGIKYDLVGSGAGLVGYSKPEKAQSAAKAPPGSATSSKEKQAKERPAIVPRAVKAPRAPKPPKPEPRFRVTFRFTAVAYITTAVQAKNQALARLSAEEMVRPPDMSKAGVKKSVLKVKREK